jgi:hypothetical protein
VVSIFFDLFNPNNRHRTEELRRLENTREDESPGEPGHGPIDLSSGTVLIRVPQKEPAAADAESEEDEVADADAEPEDAVVEDAVVNDSADDDAAGDEDAENQGAAASAEGDGGA